MAKKDKVVPLNTQQDEASSKIEIIKNLIFGDDIKNYDSELEALRRDIIEKKKALEELVEETRNDLRTALDNVATDVNIRITELEDKLEERVGHIETDIVDRKMLGKLLVDLGEKVGRQ